MFTNGNESPNRKDPDPVFLTYRKAAYLLGLAPTWLINQARQGRVPCLKVGRSYRFILSELEQFMKTAYKQDPRSPESKK